MRNTYLLLGFSTLIVLAGAIFAFSRAPSSPASPAASDTMASSTPMSSTLSLTSPEFASSEKIPALFTCDAENVNPPLQIAGVPEAAQSLVLLMDDRDVPKVLRADGVFDHWTLFNIAPETNEIVQGGAAGTAGVNSAGKSAYTGPCPPKDYEPSEHRYFFRLYALDTLLSLKAGASKAEVLKAMEGHIIAEAELMGRYKRP